MSENGNGNKWPSPTVMFGIVGMFGTTFTAGMIFESRTAEPTVMTECFDRVDNLFDRLIERRGEGG